MGAVNKRRERAVRGALSPRAQLWMVGVGLLVAAALWRTRGAIQIRPQLTEGLAIDVPITLVAADRDDLACALPQEVAGMHCGFSGPDQPWPTTDRAQLLAPYMTLDRELFVVAGLFEQPAIRDRAQADLALPRPRDAQPRFTAHCTLELVEQVQGLQLRWRAQDRFGAPTAVWVARARNCRVE
jgi:hypothetical protein